MCRRSVVWYYMLAMSRTLNVRILFSLVALVFFLLPNTGSAQEIFNEDQGIWHGQVVEVIADKTEIIPGTDTEHLLQTITVDVLDGPKEGEIITIENDYLELSKGDKFYFRYDVYIDGSESYGVVNIDRKGALYFLIGLFVLAVVIFGRWQGVRSLFALAGSFFAIFYILMPGILGGWNPVLASVLVASVILFAAIFFTHGFNRESAVAYSGTMIAVFLTSLFAIFSVALTDLSGFASEASTYLNFNTRGSLDFTALLLGAMIIGVLGVLDDIAVTQAAVVTELFNSNPALSRAEVYRKALRVGREHVGALVNTLVLAYTGASLPLLLHFYTASSSLSMSLNTELFATEIVRTIVGSIGLILAVPIVTALAVFYLKDYKPKHEHSHSHGHSH
jgi:uncharacterized membrane protein